MTIKMMSKVTVTPIVEITPRIQDIFMLVNTSRRMPGEKFTLLNEAIQECANQHRTISAHYPEMNFRLRLITFSDRAQWHVDPTDMQEPEFSAIEAGGDSAEAGKAVKMLVKFIASENIPRKIYPPIILLISDGHHTDGDAYSEAIQQLEDTPYGKKTIRHSVGIGADSNWKQLGKFTNDPDGEMLDLAHKDDLAGFVLRDVLGMLITGGGRHCVAEPHTQIDIPISPQLSRGNSITVF